MENKPEIGEVVYTKYKKYIYKEKVGFIGKDSFIVENFTEFRFFDSLRYFYKDYGKKWFKSYDEVLEKYYIEENGLGLEIRGKV